MTDTSGAEPDRARAWRRLGVSALIVGMLAAFVAARLRVTTDITHFLPQGEDGGDVELARELAVGELSRTLVVVVEAGTPDESVEAGRRLEQELLADPIARDLLAFVDASAPEGIEEAMWNLYVPRRYSFVAPTAALAAEAATAEALSGSIARLKEQLATPMSSLVTRVATRDPTLVVPTLFERLAGSRDDGLAVRDGRFVTSDERGAVIFLGTVAPSTDAPEQAKLMASLEAAFERVSQEFEPAPRLMTSGAHRFAVRTAEAIDADVKRVGTGSALGLALLLLVFFRSWRLLVLVVPVSGVAFLAGTAACLALYGSIHGLTVAFGAAMIGVSIDFAIHLYCHDVMSAPAGGPRASLRAIWPALALSAATTAVGFVVLGVSSFRGLRELAVFGAVGIVAALVATRAFLPELSQLARTRRAPTRFTEGLTDVVDRALASRGRRRPWLALPALAAIVVAAIGVPRATWSDDIADMSRLDADLVAEDEAVRERVVRFEQRRIVVSVGADDEAALAVNERAAAALGDAQRDGVLEGYRGSATLLPSARTQRDVAAAFRGAEGLVANVRTALAEQGFRPDPFAPFEEDLATDPPPPLTYADLADSALAPLVRPFRVTLDGRVAFVHFLNGLQDADALEARLADVDGARLLNVEAVLGGAYGAYRERMVRLLGIGLLLVFALVLVRHRALGPTLAAYLPAVLAAFGTVGFLSLFGVPLTLLSLVALLMVVGLGVDYGVLLAETRHDPESLRATRFAIVVAASSTLVGFGMLSLSEQPSLFAIGATAAIGVTLSLVLAPTLSSLLTAPEA